ncbi:MAG: response regulator [Pseudomonadota bacterium]
MPASRILVVDDQLIVRRVLSSLLVAQGYEVDTAEHGEQAMERLLTGAYDAVVTDLIMPVMDGVRLLEWIQSESDLKLPIVVFSGYAMEHNGMSDRLASLNVSAVLTKPLGVSSLADTLGTLISAHA